MVDVRYEAEQIKAYYLRKYAKMGFKDYLFEDGNPYRGLVITRVVSGTLVARCSIKNLWGFYLEGERTEVADELVKIGEQWLSKRFNFEE